MIKSSSEKPLHPREQEGRVVKGGGKPKEGSGIGRGGYRDSRQGWVRDLTGDPREPRQSQQDQQKMCTHGGAQPQSPGSRCPEAPFPTPFKYFFFSLGVYFIFPKVKSKPSG